MARTTAKTDTDTANSLASAFDNLKKSVERINKSLAPAASDAKRTVEDFKKFGNTKPLPLAGPNSILSAGAKFAFYYHTLRNATEMRRGLDMMSASPGVFHTPKQALAFERRMLELRNPSVLGRKSYIEKYGSSAAADAVAAEEARVESEKKAKEQRLADALNDARLRSRIIEGKQSRVNEIISGRRRFNYDRMSDSERELHDLTERYGGGEAGKRLAEDEIARRKRLAEEEARKSSELRRSKGERGFLVDTYKRLPWMKTLVDAGIIQKKELPKIAKTMVKMSKAPIVGHFIKHPMMIPLAAMGATIAMLDKSDKANVARTGWDVMRTAYGEPSARFITASRLAGFQGINAIYQLWAKLVERYGEEGAERVFASQGAALASTKNRTFRANLLKFHGWDAQTGMAAMYFASDEMMRNAPTHAVVQAKRSRLEDYETYGFSSGSGAASTIRAAATSVPGIKGAAARGELKHVKGLATPMWIWVPSEAKDAAESLMEAERADRLQSSGDTTENNVTLNIGRVEVSGVNNARQLVASIVKESGMAGGIDVMEAFDRREIA